MAGRLSRQRRDNWQWSLMWERDQGFETFALLPLKRIVNDYFVNA